MEGYSQELQDKMYQYLFKKGNTQTLNKLNEDRDPTKYPYFNKTKREIEQATSFLPSDIDFNARIYCIENEVYEHPICLYCGNKIKWNKTHKTFPTLCSASCKNYYRNIERIKEEIIHDKHTKPLFDINKEWRGVRYKYQWQCKHCGKKFEGDSVGRRVPLCPICFPKEYKGISNVELYINDLLDEYNIEYERNKRFYIEGGQNKEIDIFIPSKNIGIEVNGVYWHSEISGNKNRNYHIQKTEFFKDYFGINIIHILDVEVIGNWEIVKSLLLSKLGIYSQRIYARNTVIKTVKKKEAQKFLNSNHLQQSYIGSTIFYGLYYNNKLVQLISLGKSRYSDYEYEIHRFASLKNIQIIGGFSKLLKAFIREYAPDNILTYADRRYSNGNVYIKNNFIHLNNSQPNYFYTKDYIKIESRIKYQKHKLHKVLEEFNNEFSEWENMKNNGYDRIWDCGNMVFVYGNVDTDYTHIIKRKEYFHKPEHNEEPRKDGYVYCEVCKRNMKSLKGLKKHLTMSHPEIDRKEYYNNYLKSEDESIKCPYCGKEKVFFDKGMFYWNTCGDKECVSKLNSEKVSKHHNSYTKEEWNEILSKRKKTNLQKYGTEWVMQNEEVKEKRRQTNIKKFGAENNSQAQEWKDKVVGKRK